MPSDEETREIGKCERRFATFWICGMFSALFVFLVCCIFWFVCAVIFGEESFYQSIVYGVWFIVFVSDTLFAVVLGTLDYILQKTGIVRRKTYRLQAGAILTKLRILSPRQYQAPPSGQEPVHESV